MLGITFKENCPDIRNSRVVDIYRELRDFGMEVDVYDPWANKAEVKAFQVQQRALQDQWQLGRGAFRLLQRG